jgi:hypothetical protein
MLAVMAALHEAGYAVLMPFGENTRYDLVVDDGCSLQRIQCKTGRLYGGAVVFNTCSYYAHHPNPKTTSRDYIGQIDAFAVYCRATAGVTSYQSRLFLIDGTALCASTLRETTSVAGSGWLRTTKSQALP